MSNYAFIDGQNIKQGFNRLGHHRPNWRGLRVHLKETYRVTRAFYFLGRLPQYGGLYHFLRTCGYEVVFKEVIYIKGKIPKGNVDTELVLNTMIEYPNYTGAVIVTSDGDYTCLVKYLQTQGKLERVVSPHRADCSGFLTEAAAEKMDFLEDVRHKIQ